MYVLSAPAVPGTVELHFRSTGPDVVFRQHLHPRARARAWGQILVLM